MSENAESEYDRSSIAPSQNPSQYPGRNPRKQEVILEKFRDIKGIKENNPVKYDDPEIKKGISRFEKLKSFGVKEGGIAKITKNSSLFKYEEMFPEQTTQE